MIFVEISWRGVVAQHHQLHNQTEENSTLNTGEMGGMIAICELQDKDLGDLYYKI